MIFFNYTGITVSLFRFEKINIIEMDGYRPTAPFAGAIDTTWDIIYPGDILTVGDAVGSLLN